jgi:SAM-dependent methyltransferase
MTRATKLAINSLSVFNASLGRALLLASVGSFLTVTPVVPAQAQDGSVKPGINDKFLSEALDVKEWTGKFEGESRQIYMHRKAIVDALKLEDKQRVADIGAGTGFFSELLSGAVGNNGQIWALEISPKFLEHLKLRFEKAGLENIEVVQNTDKTTGLAESSIDLAFICDVYHHFEYPEEILKNLKHVLTGRGSLVVVDFHREAGKSEDWVLEHVRASQDVFREEIESAGFVFVEEVKIEGLDDNYIMRFRNR